MDIVFLKYGLELLVSVVMFGLIILIGKRASKDDCKGKRRPVMTVAK